MPRAVEHRQWEFGTIEIVDSVARSSGHGRAGMRSAGTAIPGGRGGISLNDAGGWLPISRNPGTVAGTAWPDGRQEA